MKYNYSRNQDNYGWKYKKYFTEFYYILGRVPDPMITMSQKQTPLYLSIRQFHNEGRIYGKKLG